MALPPKSKAPKGRRYQPEAIITDPRFANIQTDPRFRLPSKKHARTKIDQRFAHMLKDADFSQKASVDRYGRKIDKGIGRKELERFYRVEDESGEEKEDDQEEDDEDKVDQDDIVRKELGRVERKYDPAREGGFSSSEDDDSESESENEEDEVVVEEEAELAQEGEIPEGEVTARIAAVNLDWDNIRAEDIFAVTSSFVPADGRILKVAIYPSEFGRERMEREELEGPPKEIFAPNKHADSASEDIPELSEDSDSDAEEEAIKKDLLQENTGEEFDSKALRAYQLDRLRYYYAIITCSSPAVAKHIYDTMDSREYLSSANFFDLRFVPNDVTFDEKPRDECTVIPDSYKPNDFTTDALTHSKVKLTWDADDSTRKEIQKRAFSRAEIDENDLMAYIGSDSSSSESSPEDDPTTATSTNSKKGKQDRAAALRAALGLSTTMPAPSKKKKDSAAPVGDMQITFSAGLSTSAPRTSVFENEPIVDETTVEKYIRKEKERKARRKEKAKLARAGVDVDVDDEVPASRPLAKGTAPKAKELAGRDVEEEEDPFNDPFFDDPVTVSRDAARAARKAEKAKKREERAQEEAASAAQRAELELLMVEDDAAGAAGMRHFDMNEIAKAEKAKKKKKRGKKGKCRENEEVSGQSAAGTDFQMDVKDPRFSRLFESHEFAIDPTNPRFSATDGMKALLEEGRRKRKGGRDDGGVEEGRRKKARQVEEDTGDGGVELKKLVEKVKGKAKMTT
ncbi:hypothetical protein K432DRAFT_346789 [Lepidopterella palustris CBS 459.81]|uniref:NUC153 domain-containing protein n=1 Tax=Lepidopterella palustris CBS 459.81 TaxID=1314670 RepID=A0A8E2EGX6_9PEZI|nr:hypothetical protein K432DRAFT_346789 [Lepidopterella palustris CBS 459.81]